MPAELTETSLILSVGFTTFHLLHKNWDLATEEQRARIEQIKANTDRLKSGGNDDGEDGVVIVNDAPTGEDIGHCDTEVSGDIQQQES